MKINELRIGNIVYVPKTDQVVPITAIHKRVGVQVNDNILVYLGIEYVKPIKLTNEWLLKFGLIKFKDYEIYNFKNDPFQIDKAPNEYKHDCYWFFIGDNDNNTPYSVELFYVHQLQNLYYELKGEDINYET